MGLGIDGGGSGKASNDSIIVSWLLLRIPRDYTTDGKHTEENEAIPRCTGNTGEQVIAFQSKIRHDGV